MYMRIILLICFIGFLVAGVVTLGSVKKPSNVPSTEENLEPPAEKKERIKEVTVFLPQPVRPENPEEVECLALNIYHESRGSSFADRVAVTDVVLNRVKDTRYPNTVCEVVKQAVLSKWHLENTGTEMPLLNKCQFSWYCDGKSDKPLEHEAWTHAMHLAKNMYYYDEYRGITEGATHYHATYVEPYWIQHFQMICTIGNHVFYRSVN